MHQAFYLLIFVLIQNVSSDSLYQETIILPPQTPQKFANPTAFNLNITCKFTTPTDQPLDIKAKKGVLYINDSLMKNRARIFIRNGMIFNAIAGRLAIMEFRNEGKESMVAECEGSITHVRRMLRGKKWKIAKKTFGMGIKRLKDLIKKKMEGELV